MLQIKHDVLKSNGITIIDTDIANKLNNYFTSIGEFTAKDIHYNGNMDYSHCLNEYVHSVFSLNIVD